jgi:hypothetical protein
LTRPAIFQRDNVTYYNTGDWVDHCTLLAEHRDGSLDRISWDERRLDKRRLPAAERLPGVRHS